jgi:hypothetical protein
MKKYIITSILAVLVTAGTTVFAQDNPDEYLGLPGDNLNLFAVMNLFQESQTLEEFERNLNDGNSRINNLDLDGDNLVDYITVNDYVDGNVHNIALRVSMNRYETQDVAVFTVQRFRNGTVQIQLVGDEALYGKNYIVEPVSGDYYAGTYNPGYTGGNRINISVVADWPLVRFIYYPGYISWRSSWYWGYYPSYWSPWRPFYWHYYYGYHYDNYRDYYRQYRHWNHNRYERYNDFYYSRIRSHSPIFDHRMREGNFRDTYSRPDMRRAGENAFASAGRNSSSSRRPDGNLNTRSNINSSASQRSDNTRRQSPSVSTRADSRTEPAQRSSAPQRSTSSVSGRSASRTEFAQRSGSPQRSTPSVSNRSASRTEFAQRSGSPQRSTPSVSNRSASRTEFAQRSGSPQRSAPSVSNRSVSRQVSGQRKESVSSSRQSSPNTRGSSQRSSKSTRDSGSSNSSRRR